MSHKKIKMSNPIMIRLPPEVVALIQQISDDTLVPFATIVRKYVVDHVIQIHPTLKITTVEQGRRSHREKINKARQERRGKWQRRLSIPGDMSAPPLT